MLQFPKALILITSFKRFLRCFICQNVRLFYKCNALNS